MVSKPKTREEFCKVLVELIADEDKATTEYEDVAGYFTIGRNKEDMLSIGRDEAKHSKIVNRIFKEVCMCPLVDKNKKELEGDYQDSFRCWEPGKFEMEYGMARLRMIKKELRNPVKPKSPEGGSGVMETFEQYEAKMRRMREE